MDKLLNIYNLIRPVIDIGFLTFILYKAYKVIIQTEGMQLIRGIIVLVVAYAVALFLNLSTLLWLLKAIAPGLVISVAIIFQPELRKLFLKLGQGNWFKLGSRAKHIYVDSVLTAADMLSKQKRGMLVVFARKTALKDIIETGTVLNAELSSSLLVTIFGHDTPMHDGASIIQAGKVVAAGCFLPLSEQYDIKKTFGTRHRAALGLSESTDAVVLVVSEESGAISLAYDSKLHYDLSSEQLHRILEKELDLSNTAEKGDSYEDKTKDI